MNQRRSIVRTITHRRLRGMVAEILPAGRLPAASPGSRIRTYSEIGKRSIHARVRWSEMRPKP